MSRDTSRGWGQIRAISCPVGYRGAPWLLYENDYSAHSAANCVCRVRVERGRFPRWILRPRPSIRAVSDHGWQPLVAHPQCKLNFYTRYPRTCGRRSAVSALGLPPYPADLGTSWKTSPARPHFHLKRRRNSIGHRGDAIRNGFWCISPSG